MDMMNLFFFTKTELEKLENDTKKVIMDCYEKANEIEVLCHHGELVEHRLSEIRRKEAEALSLLELLKQYYIYSYRKNRVPITILAKKYEEASGVLELALAEVFAAEISFANEPLEMNRIGVALSKLPKDDLLCLTLVENKVVFRQVQNVIYQNLYEMDEKQAAENPVKLLKEILKGSSTNVLTGLEALSQDENVRTSASELLKSRSNYRWSMGTPISYQKEKSRKAKKGNKNE